MKNRVVVIAAVLMMAFCLVSVANAAWLVQQNPMNVINVAPGGTWTTTFGASESAFLSEIWAIAGKSNYTNPGNTYEIPVQWSLGELTLGDTSWQGGGVIYHLQTTGDFAGGTVTFDFDYEIASSPRNRAKMGVGSVAPTINNSSGGFSSWTTTSGTIVWGFYPGSGPTRLNRVVTLNLPAGQDIYLGVDCFGTEPDQIFMKSITVEMAPVPVPEPGSMMALAAGLLGLAGYAIRRK